MLGLGTPEFILIFFVIIIVVVSILIKKQQAQNTKEQTVSKQIINVPISDKVKCAEFIDSLEKYNKLFKNEIISQEEFEQEKKKLINSVVIYKIEENAEDFLTVVSDLKKKGILSQEDLQKIKKAIL